MLDIEALFAGKDALTKAEMAEAIKGMKLVDLESGEYVAKAKFDEAAKKASAKVAAAEELAKVAADERDALKASTEGDGGLKAQLDAMAKRLDEIKADAEAKTVALTRAEREKVVSGRIADPRFARLAFLDAEALVDEDTDFSAALERVVNEHPDYIPEPTSEPTPPVVVGTGAPAKGKAADAEAAHLAAMEAAMLGE